MKKPNSAGSLYYKIGLQARVEGNPDSPVDYGNTVSEWQEQFETRAEFIHLRGGETVLAGRLEGRHTQVIRLRSSTASRTITTDWRVVDKRSGDTFNIRDIEHETNRQFISLTCEKGVAT
ncbi:phage head closure protein [Sinorhizobium fredii]|uniref:phage head closure protein n=1 Tax=Rhizobium fredii TaxID=380 RepID=UPI0004B69A89|nr:phage head closure protein [Sinorhizobium fredii]ASY68897.1 Phage protein [Sinorhizobium fredii CCBAU 83666]